MKKHQVIAISSLFLYYCTSLTASNIATQTVTFSIDPISEISVSGDPGPLTTTTATAGNDPTNATDSSTFYAVTTNGSSEKVTASIDSPMPSGTMLCIMATAPTGATSVGSVDLSTSNQNIVTGITQVAQSNLQIAYTFEATAAAGVFSSTSRIVTFTLAP